MGSSQPVNQIPAPKQLRMTPQVFAAICETIGTRPAETGGILGGIRQTGEVTHFFFDESPRHISGGLYVPNNSILNDVRKNQWKQQGVDYLGSTHSHPRGFCRLSAGDEVYARRILEVLEIPYLLVLIVTTLADTGSVTLYPFAAVLEEGGVRIIEQELVVGGNLIRPVQPQVPDESEDGEDTLALLMELSMAAMLYGGMPPKHHRRSHYDRRRRFDYD